MPTPDTEQVDALARIALANVCAEYPFHLLHLARGDADIGPPRALHPVFHGSYDWHSCVHMHWSLARCLRLRVAAPWSADVIAHLDARLTASRVAGECAYFSAPGRAAFERPYGWGWALELWVELDLLARDRPAAQRWRDALTPLARLIAGRFAAWLPRADHPVRGGAHGNSAFALVLADNYARHAQDAALAEAVAARARLWFGADRRYPAAYEPSGDDFLSGGLCEALLMARTLEARDWPRWWRAFAPTNAGLARWLAPVAVSDASDAKIVHLHGLNLSRAWCWRQLRPRLPAALHPAVDAAIDAQLQASLAAATRGDYVGTHWLASFALLALAGDRDIAC